MVVAPAVLLATMFLAFRQFGDRVGFPLGYLLAFVLYWVVWCGAVPIAVLGRRGVSRLFDGPGFTALDMKTHAVYGGRSSSHWCSLSCPAPGLPEHEY